MEMDAADADATHSRDLAVMEAVEGGSSALAPLGPGSRVDFDEGLVQRDIESDGEYSSAAEDLDERASATSAGSRSSMSSIVGTEYVVDAIAIEDALREVPPPPPPSRETHRQAQSQAQTRAAAPRRSGRARRSSLAAAAAEADDARADADADAPSPAKRARHHRGSARSARVVGEPWSPHRMVHEVIGDPTWRVQRALELGVARLERASHFWRVLGELERELRPEREGFAFYCKPEPKKGGPRDKNDPYATSMRVSCLVCGCELFVISTMNGGEIKSSFHRGDGDGTRSRLHAEHAHAHGRTEATEVLAAAIMAVRGRDHDGADTIDEALVLGALRIANERRTQRAAAVASSSSSSSSAAAAAAASSRASPRALRGSRL